MAKEIEIDEILQFCKQVITQEVEKAGFKVIEIILFGSRAKENARPDSDWDFYVVIDKQMDFKTKQNTIMWITRRLLNKNISSDILIQSKNNVKKLKKFISYVCYDAYKEGIKI